MSNNNAHSSITVDQLRAEMRYDPDTGLFWWKKRGRARQINKPCGHRTKRRGYVEVSVFGETHLGHRLAWFYEHGRWPRLLDHINRDTSDNRLANLREATSSQNQANKGLSPKTASGYKGVMFHVGRWRAVIRVHGNLHHLGRYDTPQEAHMAYMTAAKKHFGEFARAN